MHLYPTRVLERAMKIKEVITRAMSGSINWVQAAEILGMSDWTAGRWNERGYDGLYDRQARRPSPKGVPLAEAGLYRRAFRTDEWQKQALYETDQTANQSRIFGLHLGSSSNRT